MRPVTSSEVFADLSRVVHGRWLFCEVFCKFPEDYNMCIVHIERAERETSKWAEEKELASASIYFDAEHLQKNLCIEV